MPRMPCAAACAPRPRATQCETGSLRRRRAASDMTQLILIRHGETLWNTQHRMQGHADSPLTEDGLRQARQLAQRLTQIEFKALYSSDSGRALETARIVAAATGHEIIVDSRLRERNFGVFEGLTGK